MGKARLGTMLGRDGLALSVSTIGLTLSNAIADARIQPAFFRDGRLMPSRRRRLGEVMEARRQGLGRE